MKTLLFFFFSISFFPAAFAQQSDEAAVRKVMSDQVKAWNRGSIDDFMKGYWANDSLTFIGHGGITYGYTNTLNNYKKNYSDTSKMGKLFFELLRVKRLSDEFYFVIGKWFLKRSIGDIGGTYTLLFRKISGKWVIVTDHTS
ncbi:MAG TPA: hypothetical protein VMH01_14560 [Puia sp.]|nr:hypothetical protein [Puia sp.]